LKFKVRTKIAASFLAPGYSGWERGGFVYGMRHFFMTGGWYKPSTRFYSVPEHYFLAPGILSLFNLHLPHVLPGDLPEINAKQQSG